MKKLYEKNELGFSLVWIGIYVVACSLADSLSETLGIEKLLTAPLCIGLVVYFACWLKRGGLLQKYGIYKGCADPAAWLYGLPLVVMISVNFWGGIQLNVSVTETVLSILAMIGVGILEELIFRGFLFRALCKDGVKRAVIISSLTFGIGHLVNLLNGAPVLPTLMQIVYAAAAGFLFTIMFLRSGSLVGCMVTHCAVNAGSVIAGPRSQTLDMLAAAGLTVVSIAYALWILRHTTPYEAEKHGV